MNFLTLLSFLSLILGLKCDNNSLVFVHAIFRHGERMPEKNNLYKTSPYLNESYYEPYGFGQLTNKGKLTSYNLGKSLRNRYSSFLDEKYNIKVIDARSSDFNRTKASLQAMLAGLFPPTKDLVWLEGLNWQPIAYNYVDRSLDKELFCFGCPNWNRDFSNYLKEKEVISLMNQYKETFEYITNNTKEDYNDLMKVYYLFFGFDILSELNYDLPEWASTVYPYPMKNITIMYYKMLVARQTLRQMTAGYLLKKILSDTQNKIDNKVPAKKMSIWCGHENNIGALLLMLDAWDVTEIASYGSYILMELHFIDNQYGFKIYYSEKQIEPVLLKIPGCEEFCPLDKFNALMKNDIPESDEICGRASANRLTGESWIIIFVLFSACYRIY